MVIRELPVVFADLNIRTVLDVPCGDFNWMKLVEMGNVDYTGSDIVAELIRKNAQQYENKNIRFRQLNLIEDELPKVDLIFCRDCLVHFSYKDVFRALGNMCSSGSMYLLTTTFTDRRDNRDIATGQWRPLNMELAPIALPPPLRTINEECTEIDGAFKDKSLALWRLADIKASLAKRQSAIIVHAVS